MFAPRALPADAGVEVWTGETAPDAGTGFDLLSVTVVSGLFNMLANGREGLEVPNLEVPGLRAKGELAPGRTPSVEGRDRSLLGECSSKLLLEPLRLAAPLIFPFSFSSSSSSSTSLLISRGM